MDLKKVKWRLLQNTKTCDFSVIHKIEIKIFSNLLHKILIPGNLQ